MVISERTMPLRAEQERIRPRHRLVAGFPKRRPRFKPGSSHVGLLLDIVALGQVFSEYFGFPCQSSFHQFSTTTLRGWYNRPVVAAVPKVPLHKKKKNQNFSVEHQQVLIYIFLPLM
jgi:hypothetical protein